LVGVKAELGTPSRLAPDLGRIEFFVDWCVSHAHDRGGGWGDGGGVEGKLCLTANYPDHQGLLVILG